MMLHLMLERHSLHYHNHLGWGMKDYNYTEHEQEKMGIGRPKYNHILHR